MYDVKQFSVEYFIKKYQSIPEELWCSYDLHSEGRSCAQGHCGINDDNIIQAWKGEFINEEYFSLAQIFFEPETPYKYYGGLIADINNCMHIDYQQPTPKQRILAALYDIRDKELSEANVKSVNEIINTVTYKENEQPKKKLQIQD